MMCVREKEVRCGVSDVCTYGGLCATVVDEDATFQGNTHAQRQKHLFYVAGTPCCILGHQFRQDREPIKTSLIKKTVCISLGGRARVGRLSAARIWQLACRRHTFRSCQLASPASDSGEIHKKCRREERDSRGLALLHQMNVVTTEQPSGPC